MHQLIASGGRAQGFVVSHPTYHWYDDLIFYFFLKILCVEQNHWLFSVVASIFIDRPIVLLILMMLLLLPLLLPSSSSSSSAFAIMENKNADFSNFSTMSFRHITFDATENGVPGPGSYEVIKPVIDIQRALQARREPSKIGKNGNRKRTSGTHDYVKKKHCEI